MGLEDEVQRTKYKEVLDCCDKGTYVVIPMTGTVTTLSYCTYEGTDTCPWRIKITKEDDFGNKSPNGYYCKRWATKGVLRNGVVL